MLGLVRACLLVFVCVVVVPFAFGFRSLALRVFVCVCLCARIALLRVYFSSLVCIRRGPWCLFVCATVWFQVLLVCVCVRAPCLVVGYFGVRRACFVLCAACVFVC